MSALTFSDGALEQEKFNVGNTRGTREKCKSSPGCLPDK